MSVEKLSISRLTSNVRLASRMAHIAPFYVMQLLARARELEAEGRDVVHMEIGEPDFDISAPVLKAAQDALTAGYTHYTPALGLPALRQAIADFYQSRYGVSVEARRIVITPGASGALQLALGVLVDPGDRVLMTDPGYPCNRHFVRMFDGIPHPIPVDDTTCYQLTPALCAQHWHPQVAAIMVGSPANPTGTLLNPNELAALTAFALQQKVPLLVDEIYHGLVYDAQAPTALAFSDQAFVINSFSKYFGMTGWRIGWLVVPEAYVDAVDRLAQNIFLAASTPAQYAALAAFSEPNLVILEQRRREFARRRDYLLPALQDLGFRVATEPQGAFYIYAGCEMFSHDSMAFAYSALEQAGVVFTPGIDFGEHHATTHVRFAYTTNLERLKEGVARLSRFLGIEAG